MNIKIDNLNFSFDNKEVLQNIELNFEKGKFYSIVGPNGSGKTTLLRLIASLLETPNNKVFLHDRDITTYKNIEKASQISLVPQMFNIEYEFSVEDIVLMGRYPYIDKFGKISKNDKKITYEALKKTNLLHYKDRLVSTLSGGELQRVILARAIAQETEIMLLDEPISHLDIQHQLDILNLTKTLSQKKDKTIICVIHDLNLAMKYSDKIIMLKKGEIHSMGSAYEVLTERNIKDVYGIEVNIVTVNNNRIITY